MVRVVEGKRGQVRMKMELIIRFDYGSIIPWVKRIESGISAVAGPDHLQLITAVFLWTITTLRRRPISWCRPDSARTSR